MKKVKSINKFFVITLFLTITFFSIYLIILNLHYTSNLEPIIFLFSWLGIFSYIFILITWKKITGYYLTTYSLFITFFFIFHFGQPIMWAFGIHIPTEIGNHSAFPSVAVASDYDILLAQSLSIVSLLFFHLGGISSQVKFKRGHEGQKNSLAKDDYSLKSLKIFSSIVGAIAIPVTLYNSLNSLRVASMYGYKALYYSEYATNQSSLFGIINLLFFPSLIGILIGSQFNKKSRILVYSVFGFYLILNLLGGDRGSWIYKLLILIILHHHNVKKIDFKRMVKLLIIGIVGLHIVYAIVEVRDTGLTYENIMNSLSFEKSPIISTFFEMGGSMQIQIILQKYGWDIWPYLNTYLLALLGIVSTEVIHMLNIPFELLSTFFSQGYLGISWGAGFSLIGEMLINYGPIFSTILMTIPGYVITKLISVSYKSDYKLTPIKYFFAYASTDSLIHLNRGISHIIFKNWFYGVLLFTLGVLITKYILFKK